jgi:hypothetical protein|tara:strand:- start:8880 stop:9035 length:156 start_codon:yes stop_codon:yes gene_type:complete
METSKDSTTYKNQVWWEILRIEHGRDGKWGAPQLITVPERRVGSIPASSTK